MALNKVEICGVNTSKLPILKEAEKLGFKKCVVGCIGYTGESGIITTGRWCDCAENGRFGGTI